MTPETHSLDQLLTQGDAALESEDYGTALDLFESVLAERDTFPDVHNKLGFCRAMLGDSDGALESFTRAIELAPTYAEAHLNRGIMLNELGHHEEAQAAFDEASRLDHRDGTIPSDVGNQIANAHAELGDLYLRAERPEKAADEFKRALDIRPRYLDIRNKLADTLADIGQPVEARKQLEAVLEENPHIVSARIRLGAVLKQLGDEEGAAREWKRAHEQDPDDNRPRAYLASLGVEVE